MLLIRFARAFASLCGALVLAWSIPAFAAPPTPKSSPKPPPKRDEVPVRVIAIVVNGEELAPNPAPRVVAGRLLVPVVRIYSALGIGVTRQGMQLTASAPSKQIVLTVGSNRATVDTRTIVMDTAAIEIDGATFVPLRFVADSLGAQVSYDPRAERVEVASLIVGRTPGLEQHVAGGTTQVVGTISAVDLNSAPESVTVTRSGSERTIAITSDAKIVVQDVVTRTETPASLADVHPGDAVGILLRPDGRVDEVVARYASRAGAIAAVSSSAFVLQNGYVVQPDKSTVITLNGRPAVLGDLKVGDSATIRLNPDTGEKRQIIVSREEPSTPTPSGTAQIADVSVNARGPLRAGDAFTVTLHGTPGGKATFDIGSYVTGVAMRETQPGTYSAQYMVPSGVSFGHTTIYGHLNVGGVDAPRAEASQLVAVTTTPPQIVDIAPTNGQTVNNNRPSIYATFRAPTDVGINPSSAKIEVNGLDVTASSTRTDSFITYMPSVAMNDGPVSVTITVADNAGNQQTRSFSFTIRSH
ncbi:MAG TPA: copper amine oxidase N-terminal domain-containing protein [Candidatus Limnocylindria bacterium]|nr:copper amine oxidase N-terminal domain-containing protein [Candidatus Limnocylindria bacterium]